MSSVLHSDSLFAGFAQFTGTAAGTILRPKSTLQT
jgi:hypothetical protein